MSIIPSGSHDPSGPFVKGQRRQYTQDDMEKAGWLVRGKHDIDQEEASKIGSFRRADGKEYIVRNLPIYALGEGSNAKVYQIHVFVKKFDQEGNFVALKPKTLAIKANKHDQITSGESLTLEVLHQGEPYQKQTGIVAWYATVKLPVPSADDPTKMVEKECLVLKNYTEGDLSKFIASQNEVNDIGRRQKLGSAILGPVLVGFLHLVNNQIASGDMKPQNILLRNHKGLVDAAHSDMGKASQMPEKITHENFEHFQKFDFTVTAPYGGLILPKTIREIARTAGSLAEKSKNLHEEGERLKAEADKCGDIETAKTKREEAHAKLEEAKVLLEKAQAEVDKFFPLLWTLQKIGMATILCQTLFGFRPFDNQDHTILAPHRVEQFKGRLPEFLNERGYDLRWVKVFEVFLSSEIPNLSELDQYKKTGKTTLELTDEEGGPKTVPFVEGLDFDAFIGKLEEAAKECLNIRNSFLIPKTPDSGIQRTPTTPGPMNSS